MNQADEQQETAILELIARHTVAGAQVDARYYVSALGDGFGDLRTCIAGIQRVFDERKMCGPHADLLFGQLVREAIAADVRKPDRGKGKLQRPKSMRTTVENLIFQVVRPHKKLTKELRESNIREAMGNRKRLGLKTRSLQEYRKLYKPRPGAAPPPDDFERVLNLFPHYFNAYEITSPTTIESILYDKLGRDSRRKKPTKK